MEGEAGRRPLGVFKCQLCALTAPYSYVGQKPPDTHSVVLLEESYIMKDPFTPDKDRFLVLGSRCSLCSQLVCVSPVGMQFILLQEILPPLCPGEHGRLPSGNPARLGEKESSIEEACQPAWLSDLSAARCGGGSGTSHGAPGPPGLCTRGRDGAVRELSWQPHPGAGRSSVCREQGPSLQQEGAREVGREGCRGQASRIQGPPRCRDHRAGTDEGLDTGTEGSRGWVVWAFHPPPRTWTSRPPLQVTPWLLCTRGQAWRALCRFIRSRNCLW